MGSGRGEDLAACCNGERAVEIHHKPSQLMAALGAVVGILESGTLA